MSWIKNELENRKLPDLLCGADTPEAFMARREEIKTLLMEETYGVFPPEAG